MEDDGGISDGGMTAPAVTSVAPTSAALGAPMQVTGVRLEGASSVTLGGVEQDFTVTGDTTIDVAAVDGSTPTGAQDLVVTTGDGVSDGFELTVLEGLGLTGASATDATTVVVQLNREIDATTASASAFTIAGLTIEAASVTGDQVTITTDAQTASMDYTVVAAGLEDMVYRGRR